MHFALIGEGTFVLVGLCFYVWMIVECVRRERGMERLLWLLLVLLVPDIGAMIYFLVRVVRIQG